MTASDMMRTMTNARWVTRGLRGLARAVFVALPVVSGCLPDHPERSPAGVARGATAEELPPPGERVGADGLTAAQRRGKQVYTAGTSPNGGAITAALGQSRDTVSASLVACVNCHGRDGRGRPEGGLDPPDLDWRTVSRPRPADRRRSRPAYTASLVGRVVTMGLDSAGERLGIGMPRYQLSTQDLSDLIAYLQVLGTETDPGVMPTTLRLGSLLPPGRDASGFREAVSRTLNAYAADVNARGGVYQRMIEFVYESDDSPEGFARFLKAGQVFALVAPFLSGREEAVMRVVREEGIPVIGPFADSAPATPTPDRLVFFTRSGLAAQVRVLAGEATRRSAFKIPAIVRSDDPAMAEAAAAWVQVDGRVPEPFVLRADAGEPNLARLVEVLAARGTDLLVYLGPAALTRPLIVAADRASWHPSIYLPGALCDRSLGDLPSAFDQGRIVVTFPYLPTDVTRSGRALLDRLRADHGLPMTHEATQIAVLTALKVLEEGLRRSGRDLSRAGVVDELERLNEFETGFSRPLTFGPNRRVGSPGAYLLSLDDSGRRFRPIGWSGLSESIP